jgi:hypothetical protein
MFLKKLIPERKIVATTSLPTLSSPPEPSSLTILDVKPGVYVVGDMFHMLPWPRLQSQQYQEYELISLRGFDLTQLHKSNHEVKVINLVPPHQTFFAENRDESPFYRYDWVGVMPLHKYQMYNQECNIYQLDANRVKKFRFGDHTQLVVTDECLEIRQDRQVIIKIPKV